MQFLQNSKILLENFNSDNNKLNKLPRRFSARNDGVFANMDADPSTGSGILFGLRDPFQAQGSFSDSGILGCCRVAERSRSTLLCNADPSTRRLEATLPFQGSFSGSGILGCCRVAERSRSTLLCHASGDRPLETRLAMTNTTEQTQLLLEIRQFLLPFNYIYSIGSA